MRPAVVVDLSDIVDTVDKVPRVDENHNFLFGLYSNIYKNKVHF